MLSSTCFSVLFCLFCALLSSASNNTTNAVEEYQTTLKTPENSSACGGVYIEKQFVLKSPNYPENYSSNAECYYLLKGPDCPTYYQFKFLNFSLQNSENCTKDKFIIEDHESLCGNKNNTKTYFANNGSLHITFKADEDSSGKGYLIQVTRMACEKAVDSVIEGTIAKNYEKNATYKSVERTITPMKSRMYLPSVEEKISQCCDTVYTAKQFFITSPNFPYTSNKMFECAFQIRKANENICRLRLNFLYFWLGYTDSNNCPHGYLEIDGKYICGCNQDLKLTTAFESSDTKLLRFKSEGYYQTYNSGFVIEVIQDECPTKYSPDDSSILNSNKSHQYEIHNDQINRVALPSDYQNLIEKLQLINQRTEIIDDDRKLFVDTAPKIVKSIYFFAPLEYYDKERTTFLDTSRINSVLTNSNYYQCSNWNQMQYNILNSRYKETLTCPGTNENSKINEGSRDCVDLNNISGYFNSPGYPCYYPGNLDICYRLRKQPGYCTIKIFVQDFQIENSFNCMKDYLLLGNGEKYCGNRLDKAAWTIDLRNKEYEDMRFVTDSYYCARGFSGVYQQIACQDEFPVRPVETTTPPIITTTPVDDCNKIIMEKSFTLEISKGHSVCSFNIRKHEEDVCKINFHFEKFDLKCSFESLIIDGTMYCGRLSGKMVKVNVNSDSMDIVYRSTLENDVDELKFKIRGEQISDDCLYVEPGTPEPQRLVSVKPESIELLSDNSLLNNDNELKDSKYLIAFVNKNFKDICGIVTNSTERELPSSFCEILTNDHNATKCVPLEKEIMPNVPYEIKKLGMELHNQTVVKEFEELDIHEIDCDNLYL